MKGLMMYAVLLLRMLGLGSSCEKPGTEENDLYWPEWNSGKSQVFGVG